jgi:hypothetical protein
MKESWDVSYTVQNLRWCHDGSVGHDSSMTACHVYSKNNVNGDMSAGCATSPKGW